MTSKYDRLYTERDVVLIARRCVEVSHSMIFQPGVRDVTVPEVIEALEGELTFPADEPLFLLRGQDAYAPTAVRDYLDRLNTPLEHRLAVERAQSEMVDWQRAHPDRVRTPD